MKSIDKKNKIIEIKRLAKKLVIGKVTVTSLFVFGVKGMPLASADRIEEPQSIVNEIDDNTDEKRYDCEEYSFYHKTYNEALSSLNDDDFDKNFEDIYYNGKFIINDIEYNIKQVYITRLDDGSVHLYKAGDNRKDIITNQTFTGKYEKICCFRNSSVFYDLYSSNVFNSNEIKLDSSNLVQINNWDDNSHYKTKNMMAEKITKEAYGKKYGK